MAKSKKKKRRPADLNKLASSIVKASTEGEPKEETPPDNNKNPHAVALGKLGGLKGGKARAKKLTAEQRTEIARLAAYARWRKSKD